MINILVGLPILFLLVCLSWDVLYFLDDTSFSEPPAIIKIIGAIEFIVIVIVILLLISWAIGQTILELLGGKDE